MTANTETGVGPPQPKNEKGARAGANLHGATETPRRLSIFAESVKQEADKYFMLWLTGHGDYYRRLARAASDAARKP